MITFPNIFPWKQLPVVSTCFIFFKDLIKTRYLFDGGPIVFMSLCFRQCHIESCSSAGAFGFRIRQWSCFCDILARPAVPIDDVAGSPSPRPLL